MLEEFDEDLIELFTIGNIDAMRGLLDEMKHAVPDDLVCSFS